MPDAVVPNHRHASGCAAPRSATACTIRICEEVDVSKRVLPIVDVYMPWHAQSIPQNKLKLHVRSACGDRKLPAQVFSRSCNIRSMLSERIHSCTKSTVGCCLFRCEYLGHRLKSLKLSWPFLPHPRLDLVLG